MKTAIVTLATAATLFNATTANAGGMITALSDSDWTAIENEATLENMLAIDQLPVLEIAEPTLDWEQIEAEAALERLLEIPASTDVVANKALALNLERGRQVNMILDAPYTQTEQVGVAVIDAAGNVLYNRVGTFAKLQHLHFNAPFMANATYIVRVYSAEKVFETSLQVVNM